MNRLHSILAVLLIAMMLTLSVSAQESTPDTVTIPTESVFEDTDIEASNGVLHSLDTVLMPATIAVDNGIVIMPGSDSVFVVENFDVDVEASLEGLGEDIENTAEEVEEDVEEAAQDVEEGVDDALDDVADAVEEAGDDLDADDTEIEIEGTEEPATDDTEDTEVEAEVEQLPTLAEIIADSGNHTTMQNLLEATTLDLNLDGHTVLAPTDAAFTVLLELFGMSEEDLLNNTQLVNDIVSFHLIPRVVYADEFLNGTTVTTVYGLDVNFIATPTE